MECIKSTDHFISIQCISHKNRNCHLQGRRSRREMRPIFNILSSEIVKMILRSVIAYFITNDIIIDWEEISYRQGVFHFEDGYSVLLINNSCRIFVSRRKHRKYYPLFDMSEFFLSVVSCFLFVSDFHNIGHCAAGSLLHLSTNRFGNLYASITKPHHCKSALYRSSSSNKKKK